MEAPCSRLIWLLASQPDRATYPGGVTSRGRTRREAPVRAEPHLTPRTLPLIPVFSTRADVQRENLDRMNKPGFFL